MLNLIDKSAILFNKLSFTGKDVKNVDANFAILIVFNSV